MHHDRHPRRGALALASGGLLALLLALASCGTPSTANTSTPPAATATAAPVATDTPAPPTPTTNPNQVAVRMVGTGTYNFTPASVTVKVGGAVVWTNASGAPHTVTSDASSAVSWDSGVVDVGTSYTFTFTKPGTYTYHCSIHPNMTGTVIVTA